MIFWLNFPKDTAGSEPGKLSMGKTKSCETLRKTVLKAHPKLGGKLCLVPAAWLRQSLYLWQLKRCNLEENTKFLLQF